MSMKTHHIKNFSQTWLISSRYKTPRISKTSPSNHKTIQFYLFIRRIYFCHTIIKIFYISITNHRNSNMFFEFINLSKISISCICLFRRSSMNSNESCSGIFQSFYEINECFWSIPPKTCFY